MLTTNEICDSLFEDTDWTPVVEIEGHAQLVTPEGVVVAKEVMDLVDWLVEHQNDAASGDTDTHIQTQDEDGTGEFTRSITMQRAQVDLDGTHERLAYDNLQRMAEDLQRAHNRIKAAVEESRKAVRQTCADIFIRQNQLETENAYQSAVTETITNIVGVEVMQGIKEQLDMAGREGGLSSGTPPNVAQIERKRRRTPTPYHVLTFPTGRMGLKRNREDEDVAQNFDSPHIRKRPRLVESSSINSATPSPTNASFIPRTILNYSSNDEGTDDTYSDSNGTERDFVDEPYSDYDLHDRHLEAELLSWLYRKETSEEDSDNDNSQKGVPWNNIADFDEDTSDSEYQPRDWDLEDVWEVDTAWKSPESKAHRLYRFNFADELCECEGVMSDCGLSTDDPDKGYHDISIIQRPSTDPFRSKNNLPASLGPHLIFPRHENRALYRMDIDDETFEQAKETAILRTRYFKWTDVRDRLLRGQFPSLDLEQRLAHVLGSDHTHFYFDEEEWRCFVEPPLSTRHNTIEITTPEAEA